MLPGGSAVKNPHANAGDVGSGPASGRSPGEGNGNPLQYSCLGNAMGYSPRGHKESDMTLQQIDFINQASGYKFHKGR